MWLWYFPLVLLLGGLSGSAITLSYLPITGPPAGIFWVVFLLPILKLLISWPVAALIGIFIFRAQIASLIPRIQKGPGGTEFGPANAEAQAAVSGKDAEISGELRGELSGVAAGLSTVEGRATGVIEALSGVEARATAGDVTIAPEAASAEPTEIEPSTGQVIQNLHPAVTKRFQILNETLASGEPVEDRLRRALVDLADIQVRLGFEKIYRIITGSQLDALLHLHARPWGVSEDDLRKFYTRDPETAKSLTWETWRGFLIASTGFVRVDEKGNLIITPPGELFLGYLLRERYTAPKPL